MQYFDRSMPHPAAQLACDEALLDLCESTGEEALRFWESPDLFVVLGFSNSVATEVKQKECQAAGVGIFRRASGGGTVLQGPGCFNYALTLRSDRPEVESIPAANRYIMEQNRRALAELTQRSVRISGCTDLAIDDLKFSGNAQRRKRHALLFHGTFLLNFDLGLMEKFLAQPSREPEYRAGRAHYQFLTNLEISAEAVKNALRRIWQADAPLSTLPDWKQLAAEKYSRDDWNLKF